MKNKTRKIILGSFIGVSVISAPLIYSDVSLIKANAVGWGDGAKVHEVKVAEDGTVLTIKFNTNFDSPQADSYGGKKEFYRETYFPESKSLVGGFVWFSPVPKLQDIKNLKETDMGAMLENRQTALGSNYRDHIVKEAHNNPYKYNLKYGSSDPWGGLYKGNNTGSKTLKYGEFKGKKYEWRFLGYNMNGNAVGNPYFPSDSESDELAKLTTNDAREKYWSKRAFIKNSWLNAYSINAFGPSDDLNVNNKTAKYPSGRKTEWIAKYFLPAHPEYAKKGNASYWANYLRPLTDPSKETGVWLAWHNKDGGIWYNTIISAPPIETNLRMIDYKIFDSQNKLIARQTRSATNYKDVYPTIKKTSEYVSKGETYRIEVDVKNMTDKKINIKNFPIELEHMYSFDDKIGEVGEYSTSIMKDTADAPNEKNLASGQVAHFSYTYKVPVTEVPKQQVEFNAQIPASFFEKGYNTVNDDDTAKIALKISPENLAVKFEGYYDFNKQPVDFVSPNFDMYVKYKVIKKQGKSPVKGADLKINLTDTKTVTKNLTHTFEGAYDKKGNRIADGILKKEGDYAIFWSSIVPKYPKICTEASIPAKWATDGLNENPADDYVKPACLVNPDNIVVSNFVAKPQTTYLGKTQNSKSVQYTVTFNLTNYNFDKKDKTIPLVYTIDGVKKFTEEVRVDSLKTMKISRILPAVTVGVGTHVVQVEANPKPRKYVEVKMNSLGTDTDPYSDNIGWDKVNVQKNRNDFTCAVRHTANYWNTTFNISTWHGHYESYESPNYDSEGEIEDYTTITYPVYEWDYTTETVGFNEKQEIKNIFFKSKFTTDKNGGWVDLLSAKGTIKAGYGFELKVVTGYTTNTYNNTPKPFDYGVPHGRLVSPQYSAVDSSARLKVTMPFTDDTGEPIALILDGNQSGAWYNTSTTYELEPRTVINKVEKKMYINENTTNGNYNVRVETEPIYGSYDKPSTSSKLCDIRNVTIEVKGSYLEDMNTSIVQ